MRQELRPPRVFYGWILDKLADSAISLKDVI